MTEKIAFFIPSLRGGGAERMFARMATHFTELGHSVDMVVMSSANSEYQEELSEKVRMVDLKTPRLWTSLPAFRRYCLEEKPDVVISAMPLANGIAAWVMRLMKAPPRLVITEHNAISMAFGDLDVPKYRPLMWLIRPSYRWADAAVGVSEGVAKRLRRMAGLAPNRVYSIPNPAWAPDIETHANSAASTHGWLEDKRVPIIISAGRMEAQKDFANLLRAFSKVRSRRLAKLVIIGEGSQRRQLEALAIELGIDQDLAMPGFQKNPFVWFAKADVYGMSSIHEGLPTVLIECMACGTPVVSTDCPSGPSEILEGGVYGPLVPVGDHAALAEAIEQQLDNPISVDWLKARAREFSIEASCSAYWDLIENLMRQRES